MTKNKKIKTVEKIFVFFFYQKLQLTHPQTSLRTSMLKEKPSAALKKEYLALQSMKFLNFFSIFVGPDPDPLT
jgi:hypothetical protein